MDEIEIAEALGDLARLDEARGRGARVALEHDRQRGQEQEPPLFDAVLRRGLQHGRPRAIHPIAGASSPRRAARCLPKRAPRGAPLRLGARTLGARPARRPRSRRRCRPGRRQARAAPGPPPPTVPRDEPPTNSANASPHTRRANKAASLLYSISRRPSTPRYAQTGAASSVPRLDVAASPGSGPGVPPMAAYSRIAGAAFGTASRSHQRRSGGSPRSTTSS